ncbi:MAG: 2-oxoacid:acceptor oxidoreductase subunit alpha [Propionibacteriaceae bacterium]|jgi:2-oxoglutarate ferredoxin oxidoreductase subunit alpha|nr:2-oxoacid:acceptor oxidoreductase subunit alpha [Propionibacteriaceae bacterium]
MAEIALDRVVIRFAGDSGDGIQLAGDRFAADTALVGNDFSTLPNYPAEIRAPQGTIGGVSSFQVQIANSDVHTPGDHPNVLVALNPAALKANLADLEKGGIVIVDTAEFTPRSLAKVGYDSDPLTDGSLDGYQLAAFNLTAQAAAAVEPLGVSRRAANRTRNFYALGLLSWLYERPIEGTIKFLEGKFAKNPLVQQANIASFKAGHTLGENSEIFASRYKIKPAPTPPGTYRQISGNRATAYGLMAGAAKAGMPLFLGAYPITPASDVFHYLAEAKSQGVMTFQAEDEIAAACSAVGASFAGQLGVTVTSGPGVDLKTETIGLAVMMELPMVIVNVQRGGPSTGLPTKTEQADLLQAIFGRHGEAPLPVVAAGSPSDCFDSVYEAIRIAVKYRTPVIMLSDGYIGNGAEPWSIPDLASLPAIDPDFTTEPNGPDGSYLPYRRDPETLARAWAIPGTPGLEHRIGGLEKAVESGAVSYESQAHADMIAIRHAKIAGIVNDIPNARVDDPDGDAKVCLVSWGSAYGAVWAATRRLRRAGRKVARIQLRHLNPLPGNLGEALSKYERIIVPEINLGQLSWLLRAKYLVNAESYSRTLGQPLSQSELAEQLIPIIDEISARTRKEA